MLKNDLFNSLIYLHSQPPLWNLFNGIIAKIMNGEINLISKFFNIYHCFLTLLIIYFFIKILREFFLNNKIELFIFFFITLNPSIIFFENIFSYAHTTLFFFTLNTYNIIKLFKTNNYKYEIYIYLNILILSFIWILFQPIILLIVFLSIRLLRKNSKKVFFSSAFGRLLHPERNATGIDLEPLWPLLQRISRPLPGEAPLNSGTF